MTPEQLRQFIARQRENADTLRTLVGGPPNQMIINFTCAGGMDEVTTALEHELDHATMQAEAEGSKQ